MSKQPKKTARHQEVARWVTAGFPVLLLRPRDKAPITSIHHHGFKSATTDIDVIRRLLTDNPTANYGIVPPDDVLVIDVDPKNGGQEPWEELLSAHGALPTTLRTLTGSTDGVRGQHIWFRAPELPTGGGDLVAGVEYKCGPIGYLVGPRSKHPSGDIYERQGDIDHIAPAPEWLINLIQTERDKPLPTASGNANWTVGMGQRHHTLTSTAGHLCNAGYMTPDEFAGALLVLAPRFDDSDGALAGKIDRIAREVAVKWSRAPDAASAEANQAQSLIRIASEHYDFGIDDTGSAFVIPTAGVRIAKSMSSAQVSSELMMTYFEEKGTPPTPAAIKSALAICEAKAGRGSRTPLSLRIARKGSQIAVDLGRADGRCIVIRKGEWKRRSGPPSWAIFKRTALTGEMVMPRQGGSIDTLRSFAPVTDENWDLLVAWMVAVLLDDGPIPVLSLTGEHGSGKSTLGRLIAELLDPNPSPLRQPPSQREDWLVAASGSRVVGIDNLSRIPLWLSDSMCRAVTGEGYAKRALYTDDELSVIRFKRALLLTSIDPGELRGDLASRLLPIELTPPVPTTRRSEGELNARVRKALPLALGGLFDLAAEVLANRVTLAERPRMADFAEIAASVDRVRGSNALSTFVEAQNSLTDLVAESDSVAMAVEALLGATSGSWSGTPTELLSKLTQHRPFRNQRGWPGSPRVLAQRLNRLIPTLRERGIEIERFDTRPKRITLTRT